MLTNPNIKNKKVEEAVAQAVATGAVSVRDLSRYTTQVLQAVEESGAPLLITRHGQVVAELRATTLRDVLERGRVKF